MSSHFRRLERLAIPASLLGLTLALAGIPISAPSVLATTRLDQMFRNRLVVEELGGFGFHVYDTVNYLRATALRSVSGSRTARRTRPAADRRRAGPLRGAGSSRVEEASRPDGR